MGTLASLMAGCSTDSTRLTDPFSNPFDSASTEPVRHVASTRSTIPAGRTPPVVSQALPAPSSPMASAAPLRPQVMSAYRTAPVSRETTGSIEPAPFRTASGAAYGNWSSSGGVGVTVSEGDTVDTLSKRYGVPPTALLQTNGYRTAADVRPGNRLTIPVYNASAPRQNTLAELPGREVRPEPRRVAEVAPVRAPAVKPVADRPSVARPAPHTLAPAQVAAARPVPANGRDHRNDVARTEVPAPEAKAPRQAAPKQPAVKQPAIKSVTAKAVVDAPKVATALKSAPVKTAAAAPVQAPAKPVAAQAKPAEVASAAPAAPAVAATADGAGNPEFRWPARGRIIQGFKGGNDGINIAVPEGTSVKAAEGGTVAYAGSELKGYGNLVLIRHPNGFVTAYANNGELDVKRGDQVKRGQTIAKSGQSGNVSSPQLHFELRKGATPVDPTQYLAGL